MSVVGSFERVVQKGVQNTTYFGHLSRFRARIGFWTTKNHENHENHENGQNEHFLGCRGKCQKWHFFSSRKPKWVCVICGVPLVRGSPRGGSLFGPLFGHFWGSKMTPFNPQMGLFAIVIWNRVVSEGCPKWPQKSLFFKNVKKCQNDHFLVTFWTPYHHGKGSKNGVKNDPKNGPFWDPYIRGLGGKNGVKRPKMGQKRVQKVTKKGHFGPPLKSRFWLLHSVCSRLFWEGGPKGCPKYHLFWTFITFSG